MPAAFDLTNEFALDPDLVENGFLYWFDEPKGVGVRLRADESEAAVAAYEKIIKPYTSFRKIPPEEQRKINARYVAHGLVVEWLGEITVGGQRLPKEDPAKVAQLLSRPEFAKFVQRLQTIARQDVHFRRQEEDTAEKNSVNGPNGSSAGAKTPKTSE